MNATKQIESSFYDLATPLVRRWKLMILLPVIFGAVAAAISLVVRPSFTAVTSLIPATSGSVSGSGGLAGLAGFVGQLGISTAGGGAVSPEFFASVLKSRELLQAALESEFEDPAMPGSNKTLLDLIGVRGNRPEQRLDAALKRVRSLISTSVDARTGIVTLTVEQSDPRLAAAVANRLTELLNQFNLERRQSQSREQRRFTAERLQDAERELRSAEQVLLRFLQRNRQYRGAPLLEFEANRLERTVQLRQEVFITLTKALEEARISEVRDTPVLTIIDHAVVPYRRSAPHRKLYVFIGIFLGLIAATVLAFVAEQRIAARNAERHDYQAFSEAWGQARRDLSSLLRRSRSA